MPFIPVPNTWEVAVHQNQGAATRLVNVYHILLAAPATLDQATADQVAAVWEDAYESSTLTSFLRNDWSLSQIIVTDLTTATAPQFSGSFDALSGSDSSDPLAPQTSLMFEWTTALRGRSFRGKTYHGGFAEDGSTGQPSATVLTVAAAFCLTIRTNVTSGFGGAHLAIVSRFSGSHLVSLPSGEIVKRPTPRVTGLATVITGHSIDPTWRTQRRRSLVG